MKKGATSVDLRIKECSWGVPLNNVETKCVYASTKLKEMICL